MFWNRKPAELPKPIDRAAVFRSAVDQALRDATLGRENDWKLKTELARSLKEFASVIEMQLATCR